MAIYVLLIFKTKIQTKVEFPLRSGFFAVCGESFTFGSKVNHLSITVNELAET
jgi:hypothetical protein